MACGGILVKVTRHIKMLISLYVMSRDPTIYSTSIHIYLAIYLILINNLKARFFVKTFFY